MVVVYAETRVVKPFLVALALAWAALLSGICSAHASELDRALYRLCGARGIAIAPILVDAAERHDIDVFMFAANVAAESGCRPRAYNRRSKAVGLGQLIAGKSAAIGYTTAQLFDPWINLDLSAQHLKRLLLLCGTFAGAVAVYHGRRHCRPDNWSWRVLGILRAVIVEETS
jgi:soluble lytic murein transglycosylase-like protein